MKTRILLIAIMLLTLTGCSSVRIYPNEIIGSKWACTLDQTTTTFTASYYSQYSDGTTYIGYHKRFGSIDSFNASDCEPQ